MNVHLVNQAGLQVLLCDVRATAQGDVFTMRRVSSRPFGVRSRTM